MQLYFFEVSATLFYSDAWQVWWLVLSNRVHCIFQEIDSSSDLCHDIASLLGALLIKPWYSVHVHTKVKGIVVFRDLRFKYKSDLLPGVNSSVDTFLEMLLAFLLQHTVVTISIFQILYCKMRWKDMDWLNLYSESICCAIKKIPFKFSCSFT